MALENKISGVRMVVEQVHVERGSTLNVPLPLAQSLAIYLEYYDHWIRTDGTGVKISAVLRMVPEPYLAEGLHRFDAKFMFEFELTEPTDSPEVLAFLGNPAVVDQHAITHISAFTSTLSKDMLMNPITLAPRSSPYGRPEPGHGLWLRARH